MRNLVLISALAMLLGACASPPVVESDVQLPARVPEAARLTHVAVLGFGRAGPTDIAPQVEAELSGARLAGNPYFTLVERARMDAAVKELSLASTGLINEATAARVGKMIAAKGIYTGTVTRDQVSDQPYQEKRTQCVQYEELRDKKGRAVQGKCLRENTWAVTCNQRTASFEFVPKLIDVSSAKIIYTRSLGGSSQDKGCSDSQSPIQSADELRREAVAAALALFRQDVAPFTTKVRVVFMSGTDGFANPAAKERFNGSMSFARENRLDRACEVWKELVATERAVPSLTYNVGACAEISGDLPTALARYTEADRMLTKPEQAISDGLERIRKRQAAARAL